MLTSLHRNDRRQRSRPAFTLAEMLIALVVAGVLSSMVARGIRANGYRGDAAARTIRSAMQQAQRTAILRQYDVIISFDSSRGRFRVFEDANNNRVVDATELVSWHSLENGLRFSPPSVGIDSKPASSFATPATMIQLMPSVAFHRDGSASDALVIYVKDGSSGTTTMRAVAVTRSTGRTQWYKGNGTAWKLGGL